MNATQKLQYMQIICQLFSISTKQGAVNQSNRRHQIPDQNHTDSAENHLTFWSCSFIRNQRKERTQSYFYFFVLSPF